MRKGLEAKFSQNSDLAVKLIETHPKLLQEGNRWSDSFWGYDFKTHWGENWLGRLLMDLRNRILLNCVREGLYTIEKCITRIYEKGAPLY